MAADASGLTPCHICPQVSEPVLTCYTGASGTVKLAKKEAKPAAAAKKTEPKEEKKEKKPAVAKAKTATKAKAAPKAKATATVCSSHVLSHSNC
jgi:hypothetical protein